MQNISELRKSLIDNYDKMKVNKMNAGLGKELSNTAGKIIASAKLEVEYMQLLGVKRIIPFLEPSDSVDSI